MVHRAQLVSIGFRPGEDVRTISCEPTKCATHALAYTVHANSHDYANEGPLRLAEWIPSTQVRHAKHYVRM